MDNSFYGSSSIDSKISVWWIQFEEIRKVSIVVYLSELGSKEKDQWNSKASKIEKGCSTKKHPNSNQYLPQTKLFRRKHHLDQVIR